MHKIVRFHCSPRYSKQQAFEDPKQQVSSTIEPPRLIFEDANINSSTSNIFANESPYKNENILCSGRALIITFLIIILIIIVVAITLGVLISTINSRKKTSESETNTNNINSCQYYVSFVSSTASSVMASTISIGSQVGPPCLSYTSINDPTRNIAYTTVSAACDSGSLFNATSRGSWIRFIGTGGTTMAISPPGRSHCGGYISTWLNGTLPASPGSSSNGTIILNFSPGIG
ncbi:hypothetical protein I4U23_018612 [Adineta vaga]|nr:hypothetical protein I4U23_018612 [Adineta vaga]